VSEIETGDTVRTTYPWKGDRVTVEGTATRIRDGTVYVRTEDSGTFLRGIDRVSVIDPQDHD